MPVWRGKSFSCIHANYEIFFPLPGICGWVAKRREKYEQYKIFFNSLGNLKYEIVYNI